MARKLFNFCLAWALVMGCWGGALAAALCPHVGCETMGVAPVHDAAHDEHPHGESHETGAPDDYFADAGDHHGHTAESPAAGQALPGPGGVTLGPSGAHDSGCSHCVGRRDAPPSSKFEGGAAPAGKAGKGSVALAALKVVAPAAAHVRRITPGQHAPPGSSDRHLLLSVFRI